MAVLFATNANAVGIGGIQVNIGEPPKVQIAMISLASAGQTENSLQSEEAEPKREYPDSVDAPKPEETKSARIKKPVVRSVKRQIRIPGSVSPSLSSAASRADSSRTSGDVGGKKKVRPSDKLSLLLSMTLSIPGNASTQLDSPTKTSNAPQGEPVAIEGRLSELYAQIAETEKMIQAQQSQLDILDSPSNSDVVGPSVIAQSAVVSNVPNIDSEQIKPQMVASDVQPASKGENSQIESLEMSWIKLAIGLVVLLLTALGFVWYRKGKATHKGMRRQLQVVSDVHEDTELVQLPAITKTSVPVVEQSMKTPAYPEKKIQYTLPPEYEMLEEADIYLQFGHDKFAEEALKEAIKINPRNPQAYLTLLRIYFSREDSVTFFALATQLKSFGDENVWNKVAEMGRNLDPNNTLYN